jgi:branched-chain amino acid transport system substrate-binding protein
MPATKSRRAATRLRRLPGLQVLFALGTCALALASFSYAQTSPQKPFKVGVLGDYTGPLALAGKETADGLKLVLQNARYPNWQVQLVEEDGAGAPAVALSKLRKLVEQDQVSLVVGPTSSPQAAAAKPYINERGIPTIFTNAFAKELTGPKDFSRWVLRTLETSDQDNVTLANWIAKNTPYKRIYVLASNFAPARASADGFMAGFKAAGGTIVGEAYPAFGAPDFGPTLSALDPSKVDAVYAWFTATDGPRFLETYTNYGLKKRLPLIGGVSTFVDESFLDKVGDAALDVITASNYSPVLDTPGNVAFVRAYTDAYKRPINTYAVNAYTAAQLIDAALKQADKGATLAGAELISALKKVAPTIASPTGKISFDEYGQVTTNIYIRKVQREGGQLKNTIIATIPNVSQADTWGYWATK